MYDLQTLLYEVAYHSEMIECPYIETPVASIGEVMMFNRLALKAASKDNNTDMQDVWPVVLADFSFKGIIQMNADLITDYGGMFLGNDNLREDGAGKIHYALDMLTYHTDRLGSLWEQAGWLWNRLIMGHPFHDGNKRTALAAMLAFLQFNKEVIYMPDHLVVRLQEQMIRKTINTSDVARQLRKCR